MAAEGIAGRFGFYEAVDYTPSRLRRGETRAVVRSFMAHHQGMSLLSLAYLLLDRPMQRRFDVRTFVPGNDAIAPGTDSEGFRYPHPCRRATGCEVVKELPEMPLRLLSSANTPVPEVQLLVKRPLPCHGNEWRRGKQPLEGSCGNAVAGGQHVRQLGKFLLSARCSNWRVLVEYVPAHV